MPWQAESNRSNGAASQNRTEQELKTTNDTEESITLKEISLRSKRIAPNLSSVNNSVKEPARKEVQRFNCFSAIIDQSGGGRS